MLVIFCVVGEMFDFGVDILSVGLVVIIGGIGILMFLVVFFFFLGGDGFGDFIMVVVVEMFLDVDVVVI